jgi:hypothetical protein
MATTPLTLFILMVTTILIIMIKFMLTVTTMAIQATVMPTPLMAMAIMV